MTTEEIQKMLKDDLVPDALAALKELISSESVRSSDIKLVFELAQRFQVNYDEGLDNLPKASGTLHSLQGFSRHAQG